MQEGILRGLCPGGKRGILQGARRVGLPIKKSFEEGMYPLRMPLVVYEKGFPVRVAQPKPEFAKLSCLARNASNRQLVAQLQTVLDIPQKLIGLSK